MHNRTDRVTITLKEFNCASVENMAMKTLLRPPVLRRLFYKALPLAFCLFFLFPAVSEAHAILLRSDPTQGAVLTAAPTVVRMWFTESLNPTFSTPADS